MGVKLTGGREGAATALEQTGPGEAPAASGEQLSLIEDEFTVAEPGTGHTPEPGRGVGRPKGSQNRRTQAWQDYIGSQYGMPLEVLAKTYSKSEQQLVDELGITSEDGKPALQIAHGLRVTAATAALPYLHQKQPQAVDLTGKGTFSLEIIPEADPRHGDGDHGSDGVVIDGEMLDVTNPMKSEG